MTSRTSQNASEHILLFDRSALLSSDAHFWREVEVLGECVVPQSVIEELKSIMEGFSTDNAQLKNATDFYRFLPSSNWQTSGVSDLHPTLNQKLGNAVSRNSRLDLDIAQCAYGMAVLHPDRWVVLVCNQKNLCQAIDQLGIVNLAGATAAAVRQWARSKEMPESLANKVNPNHIKAVIQSSSGIRTKANLAKFNKLAVVFVSWTVITLVTLILWRSLQPKQFNQIWQKTGLPHLPFK